MGQIEFVGRAFIRKMPVFFFTPGFVRSPPTATSINVQGPKPELTGNLRLTLINGERPAPWETEYSVKYEFGEILDFSRISLKERIPFKVNSFYGQK
jgi:hypothetical protein